MSHLRVLHRPRDRPRGDHRGIDDGRSELPRAERGVAGQRAPRRWLNATSRRPRRSALPPVTTAPPPEPDPSIQRLPNVSAYTYFGLHDHSSAALVSSSDLE